MAVDFHLDFDAAGALGLENPLEAWLHLVPIEDLAVEILALLTCVGLEPSLAFHFLHRIEPLDSEMDHGRHCIACIDASLLGHDDNRNVASESRMVVHVTICEIDSRVFGDSLIDVEDILDPLHVLLLLLRQILLPLHCMEDPMPGLDTRRTSRGWLHQCLTTAIPVLADSVDLLDWQEHFELAWRIPMSTQPCQSWSRTWCTISGKL